MFDQGHIIQKQSMEVEFINPGNAMGLQNGLADMFYEKLQPQMEALFDELFGERDYAAIDTLEIDCGVINQKNWEQELTEQAIRKLKEALLQVNKKKTDFNKTGERNAAETFFFFLRNGFLPWNNRVLSIAELEQWLTVNEHLILQLKKLVVQQPKVAERLTSQFSKELTLKIITAIAKDRKDELDKIILLIKKLNPLSINEHMTDAAIVKAFSADENENYDYRFLTFLLIKVKENSEQKFEITEILKQLEVKKESSSLTTEEKEKRALNKEETTKQEASAKKMINEKPADAIYISNAGLVLLHPFLQTLFYQLKLTEENKWTDETSQHKAVAALQFLATGDEAFEEFTIVLNKMICGIDVDEIVTTELPLDEETKKECEVLLVNVIRHWGILKNTSINGLRETFLQRNGKLSGVEEGWLLQVEQKAVDVLLGHLPWGIGLIKLPWMNKMLYVEWA